MKRERNLSMDALRITACLMVIGCHVCAEGKALVPLGGSQWTYILVWTIFVHAPAAVFFMLSGVFSDRLNPGSAIKKMLYFSFNFLTADIFYTIFYAVLNSSPVTLWDILYGIPNYTYHLWFLVDMITVSLLTPFLNRISGKLLRYSIALMTIFLVIMPTIGYIFSQNEPIALGTDFIAGRIPAGLIFCGYFLLGKYLFEIKDELINKKWLAVVQFLVASVASFVITLNWDLSSKLLDERLFAANSVFVFLRSVSLFWLFLDLKLPAKLTQPVCSISEKLFGIYVIHVAVLECITKLGITPAGINGISQDSLILTAFLLPLEILMVFFISWLLAFPLSKIDCISRRLSNAIGEIILPEQI